LPGTGSTGKMTEHTDPTTLANQTLIYVVVSDPALEPICGQRHRIQVHVVARAPEDATPEDDLEE